MKKPTAMCSAEFRVAFNKLSKAALIDTLWCAAQLGTNDQPDQIAAQAARNAEIALTTRGDRIPAAIAMTAQRRIDSDPTD